LVELTAVELVVVVRDDGVGFLPATAAPAPAAGSGTEVRMVFALDALG
jgi:hypothetical protein